MIRKPLRGVDLTDCHVATLLARTAQIQIRPENEVLPEAAMRVILCFAGAPHRRK